MSNDLKNTRGTNPMFLKNFYIGINLDNIILHEKKKVVNTIRMEILAPLKCLDCNNNTHTQMSSFSSNLLT